MASLGDLYFALGLDDKQFNNAIEAAKKKVQELGANVNVSVNIDTAKALQQLQSVLKTDNSVKINADISQLTANIKQAERELQELKEKSSWNTSAISSKQGFIQNQQAQLAELQQRLKAIEALSPTINLKVSVPSSEYTKVINEVKNTLSNKAGIDVAVTPKINKTNVKEALKTALDGVEMKVNVKPAILKKGLKKLEVEANKTTLSNSITNALKNKTFKARVDLVVGKAQVQDAIRAAFQQAGLQYNTTASDVRTARIREIDSRTRSRELLDQERLNRLRNQGYNEAIRNSERLGSSVRNVNSWASQLGEQINNAFSIYALQNFVKNLITIGGEFEKQHIALQAMIGDAKLADSLFERTKDLSIKSPFTFSELTRYIKQMSAYGVEYEELYDTTKRLADISAGVGVDMNRLILAYGQVRSAEVLRGQELRQFTEAGIPLVAELARKFNELGEAEVKAGDVFKKISQKAVPFSMVRDVLFEMTDPGGRFFKMQERQAESLAGRYSNLKDAWDIMIADMSKDQHNVLSTLLDITASLIRNWEKVIPVLAAVTTAIGLYNSALTITNLLQNSLLSNPFSAALAIIGGIAAGVYLWSSTLDDVYDKIEKINSKTEKEVQATKDKAKNAERYLDALSKVSEKESLTAEEAKRKKELTDALVQMYPSLEDSLKKQKLTLEDIKKLKGEIVGLTAEETEEVLLNAKTSAKTLYDEAIKLLNKRKYGKIALGGMTSTYVDYTKEEIDEAQKMAEYALANFLEAERKYQEFIDNRDSFLKKIEDDRKSGWVQKALDAIAKNASFNIVKPKDNQTLDEYLDYLIEEASEAEKKIEKYADKTERKKYSDRMKAFNAVITAVGGRRVSKQGNEDIKKQAENDIKAYVEGLKDAVDKISEKWSLYKQLFEATGNKRVSMNIAFGNVVSYENQLDELKSKIVQEAKKHKIEIPLEELLGLGEKQLLARNIDEKAAKGIGTLLKKYNEEKSKLRGENIKEFVEIIKASRNFEQQITSIEVDFQKKLSALREMAAEGEISSDELKKREDELRADADKAIIKVQFAEFKESSDWVKVFDDLDRVSDATLDNMISKIEEFAKQAHLSEEVTKQLVEAMAKLRDEAIERNPFEGFKNAFDRYKYYKDIQKNGTLVAGGTQYRVGNGKDVPYSFFSKKEVDNGIAEANEDLKDSALAVADKFQAVANAADLLGGLFENLGIDLGGLKDVLGGAVSGAQTGAGIASAFGLAGPWGAIAGAAVGMLSSVFAMHDKALQKEIEASEARVKAIKNISEYLESILERTMGGVYSIALDDKEINKLDEIVNKLDSRNLRSYLDGNKFYSDKTRKKAQDAIRENSYYDAQLALLMAEREEVQEQMRLEDEKKKTNKDKIEDYKKELDELDMSIKYFAEDMANALYGIDFKDWASQLSEALVNAWANGEDAVLAYRDTVTSILKDLGVSVLTQKVIEPLLDETMDKFIKQFSADNGKITDASMDILKGMYEGAEYAAEMTEAYLEGLKKMGIDVSEESKGDNTLSKGIQSVTEDTANLLGSYLNAIRHDVSVKRSIIEKLAGEDIPKMSLIAQAQLTQLNNIASNTLRNAEAADKIYDLFNRVVDKGGNKLKI